MPENPKHLRALYEIAVSIGGSLDLEIMARAALFAFHRKLESAASSVVRETPEGTYVYCCCGKGSRTHKRLLERISQQSKPLAGHLLFSEIEGALTHYVFELPSFGALVLSMENTSIPDSVMADLTVLNLNFAAACIACVQSQSFRQSEAQAQKALSVKTDFLSKISHELRTPMNAVIGFANLLQRNAKPERVSQYADRIVSSAELLMALINDMLDYNTLDDKVIEGRMLTFDLHKEVMNSLQPLQKLAELQGKSMDISIKNHSGQDTFEVVTNAKRLAQVLTKITENAVKFCSEGDHIEILCDPNTVSESSSMDDITKILTFKITDTGPGIPEHLIPHLFDPFHQADNSTQRAYQGAGLGLALCKKIVEQIGGEISHIKTEQGCHIEFTWPCIQRNPNKDPINQKDLTNCRFLVVDDNAVNREVLKAMLDKFGSHIDIAANGLEAVNACQQQKYDLIFMDCHMPVMNGLDAAKVIRNLGGVYAKVPIIAVTADITTECNRECLAAGMNRFINKPMLRNAIEAITNELLQKSA